MRPQFLALSAAAMLALVIGAPTAAAAGGSCASAPGTSAVDQYCESLPGASGNVSTGKRPRNPDKTARDILPPETYSKLARSGATGASLVALVGGTTPVKRASTDKAATTQGKVTGKPRSAGEPFSRTPSANPFSAAASAVSTGPTLGLGLPIALLVVALAAVAVTVARRHSGSDQ